MRAGLKPPQRQGAGMDSRQARERIEELRQHLMDELDEASSQRSFERVEEVQQGFTALSVLERVVR